MSVVVGGGRAGSVSAVRRLREAQVVVRDHVRCADGEGVLELLRVRDHPARRDATLGGGRGRRARGGSHLLLPFGRGSTPYGAVGADFCWVS